MLLKQFHSDYERLLSDPSEAAPPSAILIAGRAPAFRQPWREASASVSANRTLVIENCSRNWSSWESKSPARKKLSHWLANWISIAGQRRRTGGRFDTSGVAQQYAAAFREDLGLNVEQATPEQIANGILLFGLPWSRAWIIVLAREQDAKL